MKHNFAPNFVQIQVTGRWSCSYKLQHEMSESHQVNGLLPYVMVNQLRPRVTWTSENLTWKFNFEYVQAHIDHTVIQNHSKLG